MVAFHPEIFDRAYFIGVGNEYRPLMAFVQLRQPGSGCS